MKGQTMLDSKIRRRAIAAVVGAAAAAIGFLGTSVKFAEAFPAPRLDALAFDSKNDAVHDAAAARESKASLIFVADGCGGDGYRGPNGACHRFGTGPFRGGYSGPYGHSFAVNHGCGAGRYRGPYGSCHKFGTGPYPGGYFGPYYR
jgi:hypothetical protein